MDEHKRWFPLQEINILTPHGLLTWKLEVNLNGICWRLKKKKCIKYHCSVNNTCTCNEQDRQKEKSTISGKNSWDTSTEHCFFPPFLTSLPPNVVYCSSLTKSCPLTLEGPEDSKVSQQFWLENNRKNFCQI